MLLPFANEVTPKGEGGQKSGRGGGQTKFYPYRKKRGKQSLSHAEGGGGHNKVWGNFNTVQFSFSYTEGGCDMFPPFS